VKIWIELSIPKDRLSLEPTSSPPKKKLRTHQRIMIMEGGDEDMEVDVTTQQEKKSIKIENDQFIQNMLATCYQHG
jgi:hypothetical protein